MGLFHAPRPEDGGLASGIVNTSYQVGCALGLAAITAAATSLGTSAVGDQHAQTDGLSAAFSGAAAIAAFAAVLAAVTLRFRTRSANAPQQDYTTV